MQQEWHHRTFVFWSLVTLLLTKVGLCSDLGLVKNNLFMKYCKFYCRPVSVTSNNSLKALLAKMLHLFKIESACLIVIVCVFCVLVACVSTFVFCEYACSDIVMWRLPHTLPSRQRVKPRLSPVAWSFLHLCYSNTFNMSTFLSCEKNVCYMFIQAGQHLHLES